MPGPGLSAVWKAGRGSIADYFRVLGHTENRPPFGADSAYGPAGKRAASPVAHPSPAKRVRTSPPAVLRPTRTNPSDVWPSPPGGRAEPVRPEAPGGPDSVSATPAAPTDLGSTRAPMTEVNVQLASSCTVQLKPISTHQALTAGESAETSARLLPTPAPPESSAAETSAAETSAAETSAAETSAAETSDTDEYEVERILDYSWCRATNRGLYLVKWLGYDREEDATWEPLAHLEDVKPLLRDFYLERVSEREKASPSRKRQLQVPPDPRTSFQKRSEVVDSIFSPPPLSELNAFFVQIQQRSRKKVNEWPGVRLNRALDEVSRAGPTKPMCPEQLEEIRHQLMLRHLKDKREDQLRRLKDWQREINVIDQWPLTVENDVDLEGPPRHMNYITCYKPAEGIDIPEDPPIGCECGPLCSLSTEESCCPSTHGHLFPYTRYGRLRVDVGVPIYECNKICSCGPECVNRVVQKGRKTKLCIFRTSNGCGWGVKTLEPIKRGTFVADYVGEVITSEEAEERGKKYDAEGRTYLFDLDFNMGQDNPYTVDAAFHGNVAHFINHSCDPNLSIFNVWVDCLDPNLPRICLFSRRDIAKGEQLTFDYCQQSTQNYAFEDVQKADQEGDVVRRAGEETGAPQKMECRCGADNCRKRLFE